MNLPDFFLPWLGAASTGAFLLFAFDKWRAGRGGPRVAESALWWVSVLGGWPGGLAAIIILRHKSAKPSFQLKFAAAVLVWAAAVAAWWLRQGEGLSSS